MRINIIWALINVSLIFLILARIPNPTNSAVNIDQNPKILTPSLALITSLFFGIGIYSSLFDF